MFLLDKPSELCRHGATKCVHSCGFYCVMATKVIGVELMHRRVFDLRPYI